MAHLVFLDSVALCTGAYSRLISMVRLPAPVAVVVAAALCWQCALVDAAAALVHIVAARVWAYEAALTAEEAERTALLDALEFHLRTTYHETNE